MTAREKFISLLFSFVSFTHLITDVGVVNFVAFINQQLQTTSLLSGQCVLYRKCDFFFNRRIEQKRDKFGQQGLTHTCSGESSSVKRKPTMGSQDLV